MLGSSHESVVADQPEQSTRVGSCRATGKIINMGRRLAAHGINVVDTIDEECLSAPDVCCEQLMQGQQQVWCASNAHSSFNSDVLGCSRAQGTQSVSAKGPASFRASRVVVRSPLGQRQRIHGWWGRGWGRHAAYLLPWCAARESAAAVKHDPTPRCCPWVGWRAAGERHARTGQRAH